MVTLFIVYNIHIDLSDGWLNMFPHQIVIIEAIKDT